MIPVFVRYAGRQGHSKLYLQTTPANVSRGQAFLVFKSLDKFAWAKTLSDSRSAYTSLKEHFLKNVENPDDLSAEDPLTDTETVSIIQNCAVHCIDAKEVV